MKCIHCGKEFSKSYNEGKRVGAMQCPYCGKNPNSTGKRVASDVVNSGAGARLISNTILTIIKEIIKTL